MPEIDCASDEGTILSDNYSQVVTGVEGCQARAGKIDGADGSRNVARAETSTTGSGFFRLPENKSPTLPQLQKPVFSASKRCGI
ncbi:hypothetical protein [Agrobacterium tumefaciens]|uniref:hypothetical protein n=1 Tax=Agrobacterium tumefaciens TaxID=358 RepID=UPI001574504E|nr:hypothetical protein [Agrobacterium tumefaciens]NSX92461.1 hypothetical protein [Agrobacterium tumefaciens]